MSSSSAATPEFWLLKIPNSLHDQWTASRTANLDRFNNSAFPKTPAQLERTLGEPIGHVWIEKGPPGAKKKMKLVVPAPPTKPSATPTPPSLTSDNTPLEYSITIKPKTTTLIFGQSVPPSSTQLQFQKIKSDTTGKPQPTPEAFKLENEVGVVADCMPKVKTSQYRAILEARQKQLVDARRKTVPLNEAQSASQMHANILPMKRAGGPKKLEKPEKRVRMANDNMLNDLIFNHMTRPENQFVTIAKLVHDLQQPVNVISEKVKLFCVRQEDGPNKGMYQLKPEYRLATDAPIDGGATADGAGGAQPMDLSAGHGGFSAASMLGLQPSGFGVKQEGVKQEGVLKREY